MHIETVCKRVCGLDVHKKIIVGTVIIEDDQGQLKEETREFGTLPSELEKLAQWIRGHNIELTAMESTGVFWKPIHAVLEAREIKTLVVNARYIKNVPGRKTDVTDSQWIASLARCGLLKGSFIPEKALRDLRGFTRRRIQIQREIARETNRLHKTLDAVGFCLGAIVSDIKGVSAQAVIHGLMNGETLAAIVSKLKGTVKKKTGQLKEILLKPLPQAERFILQQILHHVNFMEQERNVLEQQILVALEPYKEYWQILQTIPGVNQWGAAYLIAECGTDMKRFGNVEQFCSWAGICPGNNESAGKRKSGKRRKGNPYLNFTLCEIANAAIKTNSQFKSKSKHKTLVIRRGYKRSVFAIALKLLRVMYCLFVKKKHYQDPEIDYQALLTVRSMPRWIKSLKDFGFIVIKKEEVCTIKRKVYG